MPHLLYIGQAPADGTGSPVIIRRHLRRLAADGWRITRLGDASAGDAQSADAPWPVLQLPLRRKWWPPYRPASALLRKIRTQLLARECRRLVRDDPPDAVLAYVAAHSDFLPEIAAHYARLSGVPLTLMLHDDAAAFTASPAEKKILRDRRADILSAAQTCWFVSPELALASAVAPATRRVLAPLPEGWTDEPARWQPAHAAQPKIYCAGFIWPQQYPLLADLARTIAAAGGRLVLLTRDSPQLQAFLATEPADWIAPFASNREALAHLVTHAAGIVVAYSRETEEMPWIETSFPSKFVEYVHLGVPCAIVAPAGSAISAWARREHFGAAFAPNDSSGLAAWVATLREPAVWARAATNMLAVARLHFNPAAIHQQFVDGLGPVPAAVATLPAPPSAPIPVVLIGCGAVSQLFYGPALQVLEAAQVLRVVALVDPAVGARASLALKFPQARSVAAAAELPAPAAGALLIIATPPRFHAAQAEAAFAAGWNVLCEKPLAGTAAEATRMIAAATRADRLLAAGHYKRFFPAHRALKVMIDEGVFGPLQTVEIVEGGKFLWPAATDSFFRREQTPGGVLLDIGVHVLDLLLWWLGDPVRFSYADDADGGLEANCRLHADFPNGVAVSVHLSRDWPTPNCAVFRFSRATVHCRVNASNQLELTFDGLPMTFAAELRAPVPAGPGRASTALETNPQAFVAQLVDVCAAIRDRRAPQVTGDDGRRVMQWIENCYAARTPLDQPWLKTSP